MRKKEIRRREIEIIPYEVKEVYDEDEADIILTREKDMCDFLALGFFCLNISRKKINKKVVKIYYSYRHFCGNSGVEMFNGERQKIRRNAIETRLFKDIVPVMLHVGAEDSTMTIIRVIACMLYPEYTAFVDGKYPGYANFLKIEIPKVADLTETIECQKLAYTITCRYLDRVIS